MLKTNNVIIAGLVLHSISYALYKACMYSSGLESSDRVLLIWQLIFLLMVIMWIDNDSRKQEKIERCFDYQYLVYIFSPVYVPYYFYRTRGFFIGSAFLIGLIFLYWLWYIVQWTIYYFS